MCKKNR